MTPSQSKVYSCLLSHSPVALGCAEIGYLVGLPAVGASSALRVLEARGLVERVPSGGVAGAWDWKAA